MVSMENKKNELLRNLSLLAGIMIVAGSMIGSGIFKKPATMAGQLLSPELLIAIWVIAGLITLVGALINAEIACMIDDTGGQYMYFKKMYGDFVAYLYGWSILSVIQTGSQAAIAYIFAEYLGYFFEFPDAPGWMAEITVYMPLVGDIYPFAEFGTKMVAIIALLFITGINIIGVFFGGVVQTIVTVVKIGSIMLLALILLFFGEGNIGNLTNGFAIQPEVSSNIIAVIGLALAGGFWAYDGWNNVTFVAGEVKNPQRNIPLSLFWGTVIVIVVYVVVNVAFLYVFPVEEMQHHSLVGAAAAEKIFGPLGGSIISIAVIISTFGALNGSILATARVQYAMAKTRLFFSSLGKVHPKYKTPHISLAVQGLWSAVLVLTGSFDTITDYVIFAAWLFYMLGAAGIFVLRKKMKDTPRPFKMKGYPVLPALFVIFSFLFLLNTIISDTQNAMMGVILVISGLPVYFYRKYFDKKNNEIV